MNTLVLHGPPDQTDVRRWGMSAVLVVGVHLAVIVAGMTWYTPPDVVGTASDSIMLDLESAPATPDPAQDLAPGPQMTEMEPPPPEPEKQEKVEEQVPPAPQVEKAEVVAPPEKKLEPKPVLKPKVVEKPRKPTEAPAPRTTATPQAAQAARVNYKGLLSAHLQRYKQYPPGARAAGQQGVTMLNFTVTRSGQVTGARVAKSSGSAVLDNETMAMIRRAQPLPSFPPDMTESSANYSFPMKYSLN